MRRIAIAICGLLLSAQALAADPFNLPWMNHSSEPGRAVYKSTDHPNSVFVIESYFNRCPACNENAPKFNEFAAEYKNDSKVQVLALSVDDSDREYQDWFAKHNPNHPVLNDSERTLLTQINPQDDTYFPTLYVLDCKLNVRHSHIGTWDTPDVKETIKAKVAELVKENCN